MSSLEITQQMVQASVDTIRWVDALTADVTVDGRSCRITLPLAKDSKISVAGVDINVSLGQRPIEFDLGARGRSSLAMPTAPTGDAAFDERFIIRGIPIEPVVAAFDADVRRWAMGRFSDWPSFTTVDGNLQLWHQTVFVDKRRSTSPAELRASIQWTFHVADRLITEFDRAHEEVNRTGGQEAADQWVADVHDSMRRRDRRRGVQRAVALLVAFGAVFAWMWFEFGDMF